MSEARLVRVRYVVEQVIGLDPGCPLTPVELRQAFTCRSLLPHPYVGGEITDTHGIGGIGTVLSVACDRFEVWPEGTGLRPGEGRGEVGPGGGEDAS